MASNINGNITTDRTTKTKSKKKKKERKIGKNNSVGISSNTLGKMNTRKPEFSQVKERKSSKEKNKYLFKAAQINAIKTNYVKMKIDERPRKSKCSLVWFLCLMAYQLFLGYLMPKPFS